MAQFSPRRFCPTPSATGGGSIVETGTLTTRTDDNTGIVTIDNASHAIETSAAVEVTWTGGSRVAMVVGTVAGVSVPIDGGSGDALPPVSTPVSVVVLPGCDEKDMIGDLNTLSPYAWWDPSDFDLMTTTGSDPNIRLDTCDDKSGNGHTLVEHPVFTSGPYVQSALTTRQLNGCPCFSFSASEKRQVAFGETLSQPFSYAMALEITNARSTSDNYCDGLDNRARFYQIGGSGDYEIRMQGPTNLGSGVAAFTGQQLVLVGVFNSTSSKFALNGTIYTGDAGTNTINGFILGGRIELTYAGVANIGDVLVFDRGLSDSEIGSLTTMLASRWRISV